MYVRYNFIIHIKEAIAEKKFVISLILLWQGGLTHIWISNNNTTKGRSEKKFLNICEKKKQKTENISTKKVSEWGKWKSEIGRGKGGKKRWIKEMKNQ